MDHSNPDPASNPSDKPADAKPNLSFWQVIVSVFQASVGIQTDSNRERDFTQGKFLPFVIAALLFTAVFVLTIAFVVSMVLPG